MKTKSTLRWLGVGLGMVALAGSFLHGADPAMAGQFTDQAQLPAAIAAAQTKAQASGITYTTQGLTIQGNAGGTVWRTVGGDGFILHAKTASGWFMYVPNTADSNPSGRALTKLMLDSLGKKVGGLLMVGAEEEADVQINDPWRALSNLDEAIYTTDNAGRLTAVDQFGERIFEVKAWSGPLASLPAEDEIITSEDQLRMAVMGGVLRSEQSQVNEMYSAAAADPRFKSKPVMVLRETLDDFGWEFQPTRTGAVVTGSSAGGMQWRATYTVGVPKRKRGVKLLVTTPAPPPPTSMRDPAETFANIDMPGLMLTMSLNPMLPKPTQSTVLNWIAQGVTGSVESSNPLVMRPEFGGRLTATVVAEGSGWRVNLAQAVDGFCGAYVMRSAHLRPVLVGPAAPGEATSDGTCA